jgi:glyceraldehyde 3-phosphate dehydrogenase
MVIDRVFGIEEGAVTTIHAVTASQRPVDVGDRFHRSCLDNIIPSSTGAAHAVCKVLPQLANRLTCSAFRVPVSDVSVLDFGMRLRNSCSKEALGAAIKSAALGPLTGIIDVSTDNPVSSDFKGDQRSCIVDLNACTMLHDRFLKVVAWYDNEAGYAARILDLCTYVNEIDKNTESMKMLAAPTPKAQASPLPNA